VEYGITSKVLSRVIQS